MMDLKPIPICGVCHLRIDDQRIDSQYHTGDCKRVHNNKRRKARKYRAAQRKRETEKEMR